MDVNVDTLFITIAQKVYEKLNPVAILEQEWELPLSSPSSIDIRDETYTRHTGAIKRLLYMI